MHKKIAFIALLLVTIFILGRDLNPLKKEMFTFHDQTQIGRALGFAQSLKAGHIPPRVDPNFSFHMGYPLYNYYAPTAYWITSIPILSGIYPVTAMKLSFMLSMVVACIGMFAWLRNRFNFWAAIMGALIYVSSPYIAAEIFIRGTISEMWFIALLPLSLYLLDTIDKKVTPLRFILATLIASFMLTSHNVLSLVGLLILLAYAWIRSSRKGLLIVVLALLLSSYFLIPALVEMGQTYAVQVASQTKYSDHFLCIWQLWTSHGWNYGGSAEGCLNDGFSFKLGKINIILAGFGLIYGAYILLKKKKHAFEKKEFLAMLLLTGGSLFLTLYVSSFIWRIFEQVLKVFQFPWRLLVFGLFGAGYFSALGVFLIKDKKYFVPLVLIVSVLVIVLNGKYFERKGISYFDYHEQYLSEYYQVNKLAFNIPEYLPRSANDRVWNSMGTLANPPRFLSHYIEVRDKQSQAVLQNDPYHRIVQTNSKDFYVNIHAAPYWHVYVNDAEQLDTELDPLGRPHIVLNNSEGASPTTIRIDYKQTILEKISNIISLVTLIVLLILAYRYGRKSSKEK